MEQENDDKILKIYTYGKYHFKRYIKKNPHSNSKANKCREIISTFNIKEICETRPKILIERVQNILLEKGINVKKTTIEKQLSIYRNKCKNEFDLDGGDNINFYEIDDSDL